MRSRRGLGVESWTDDTRDVRVSRRVRGLRVFGRVQQRLRVPRNAPAFCSDEAGPQESFTSVTQVAAALVGTWSGCALPSSSSETPFVESISPDATAIQFSSDGHFILLADSTGSTQDLSLVAGSAAGDSGAFEVVDASASLGAGTYQVKLSGADGGVHTVQVVAFSSGPRLRFFAPGASDYMHAPSKQFQANVCGPSFGPVDTPSTGDEALAQLKGTWVRCSNPAASNLFSAFADEGIVFPGDGSWYALVENGSGALVRTPDPLSQGTVEVVGSSPPSLRFYSVANEGAQVLQPILGECGTLVWTTPQSDPLLEGGSPITWRLTSTCASHDARRRARARPGARAWKSGPALLVSRGPGVEAPCLRPPRQTAHAALLIAFTLQASRAAAGARDRPGARGELRHGGEREPPSQNETFGDNDGSPGFGNPGEFGDGGTLPALGDGGGNGQCNSGHKCDDFPASPILDPLAAPTGNPASLFGASGSGTATDGPCLAEPADGALYPRNWLRPRVYWTRASSSQTVFEVRVHSDAETNDLVVYTTSNYYTLDESLWSVIAKGTLDDAGGLSVGHLVGASLTFTVRATGGSGGTPAISNSATIVIAPAIADGALVYWTTADFDNSATNTTLQGFHVGDEGTTTALTSAQVVQPVRAEPIDGGNLTPQFQQVFCIGCHSATPDSQYVSFTTQWPWPTALASIQSTSAGAKPPWLSNGAMQNLSPDMKDQYSTYYAPPAVNQVMLGMSMFSPAHYQTGDRVLISSLGASWNSTSLTDPGSATGVVSQLAWVDLEWNNAVTTAGGVVDAGLPVATPCSMVAGAQQACIPAPASTDGGWGIIQRTGDSNSAGSRPGATTSTGRPTSSRTRRPTSAPRTAG